VVLEYRTCVLIDSVFAVRSLLMENSDDIYNEGLGVNVLVLIIVLGVAIYYEYHGSHVQEPSSAEDCMEVVDSTSKKVCEEMGFGD